MTELRDRTRSADSPRDRDAAANTMPNALWLVFRREIDTRLRNKSFLLSTVVSILLLVGVIVAPTLLNGATTYRIGLVGQDNQPIVETATALANDDAEDPTTIATESYDDVAAAEAALADGAVEAVLVDGSQLLVATTGGLGGSALQQLLQEAAGTRRVEAMVGDDANQQVLDALTSDALEVRALTGQQAQQNEARAMLAYGGIFLMYLSIVSYGVWTLNGVTEEKSNRVIELLLATARPWQLLAGKILGISALGLGQFALTVTAALIAIRVTGSFGLPTVPLDLLATLLLWVVLGFGFYMVLCGAAGALASKMEDAQSVMTPISMLAVVSFFLSLQVLNDPDGVLGVVTTFIPVTAPFTVPIRAAFGVLPVWQHVLAVLSTVLLIAVLTRVGGRVYAGGALRFGGKVGWREAYRSAEV